MPLIDTDREEQLREKSLSNEGRVRTNEETWDYIIEKANQMDRGIGFTIKHLAALSALLGVSLDDLIYKDGTGDECR